MPRHGWAHASPARHRRPRRLNADVIALQEVIGAGPNDSGHAEEIGAALGMGWVMASVRHLRGHQFGNVVLSAYPIRQHVQYDLSWRTCEPRCCQRADILVDEHAAPVQRPSWHRLPGAQGSGERLAAIVHDGRIAPPKILLGDFNEWSGGLATAALTSKLEAIDLQHPPAPQAHVSRHPAVSAPDHIYYEGLVEIAGIEIPRTRKSMMASDHLPFLAEARRWGFK